MKHEFTVTASAIDFIERRVRLFEASISMKVVPGFFFVYAHQMQEGDRIVELYRQPHIDIAGYALDSVQSNGFIQMKLRDFTVWIHPTMAQRLDGQCLDVVKTAVGYPGATTVERELLVAVRADQHPDQVHVIVNDNS